MDALNLLDHGRLELHRAEAVNLAVDVVVLLAGAGVKVEANAAHLGAGLERLRGTLDLEGGGDGDGVAVGKRIAHRVHDDGVSPLRHWVTGGVGGELMSALWAHNERRHLVGVLGGTFGAGRQCCG